MTEEDIIEMVLELYSARKEAKEYLEFYEKQGVLPAIKMSIIEERLFTKLFTKGK